MKLQIIENRKKPSGAIKISFSAKGTMTISSTAKEKYDLKAGDKIAILQDQDAPNDFWLVKTENPNAVTLRKTTGLSLLVSYNAANEKIRKHFKIIDRGTFSLGLGGHIKTEFGTAIYIDTKELMKTE